MQPNTKSYWRFVFLNIELPRENCLSDNVKNMNEAVMPRAAVVKYTNVNYPYSYFTELDLPFYESIV